MSGGRSPVFRHYAEVLNEKPRALNLLMMELAERAGALPDDCRRAVPGRSARRGADRYIQAGIIRPPMDFSDVHVEQGGQFWTDFAPKWIDLFELYEETKVARYLFDATAWSPEYATLSGLQPAIPDQDVVVNPHGQVWVHTGMKGEYFDQTDASPLILIFRLARVTDWAHLWKHRRRIPEIPRCSWRTTRPTCCV